MGGPKNPRPKRGPDPETLKVEGDWTEAVKRTLGKQRPATGWPKPTKRKGKGK